MTRPTTNYKLYTLSILTEDRIEKFLREASPDARTDHRPVAQSLLRSYRLAVLISSALLGAAAWLLHG